MAYRFPPEHERPIVFSSPFSSPSPQAQLEPESWRPRALRALPPPPRSEPPASEPPASETRRMPQPSYAEIDLVEADMSNDSRVERDE